jgi:hypothetical protein
MKRTTTRQVGAALLTAMLCCIVLVPAATAQSKKSAKQADSLEKSGESAKTAVGELLTHLDSMLAGYNEIIDGKAKNPQSAYKKLVGDYKTTEKKIEGAQKQLGSLNQEAQKFFEAWEQDLSAIANDSVREKSAKRLEAAQGRYAALGDTLVKAREELAPVVQELNDQILFLGRDLSPAAIEDLQDEAVELNRHADEAKKRIRAMLESAAEELDQAEAAIEEEDWD